MMSEKEYMKLAKARYESIKELENETIFYEFEKRFPTGAEVPSLP